MIWQLCVCAEGPSSSPPRPSHSLSVAVMEHASFWGFPLPGKPSEPCPKQLWKSGDPAKWVVRRNTTWKVNAGCHPMLCKEGGLHIAAKNQEGRILCLACPAAFGSAQIHFTFHSMQLNKDSTTVVAGEVGSHTAWWWGHQETGRHVWIIPAWSSRGRLADEAFLFYHSISGAILSGESSSFIGEG